MWLQVQPRHFLDLTELLLYLWPNVNKYNNTRTGLGPAASMSSFLKLPRPKVAAPCAAGLMQRNPENSGRHQRRESSRTLTLCFEASPTWPHPLFYAKVALENMLFKP